MNHLTGMVEQLVSDVAVPLVGEPGEDLVTLEVALVAALVAVRRAVVLRESSCAHHPQIRTRDDLARRVSD